MVGQTIATMNIGSSSLKFALYEIINGELGARRVRGLISDRASRADLSVDGLSEKDSNTLRDALFRARKTIGRQVPIVAKILSKALPDSELAAIGHRIVHGGRHFVEPVRFTPSVLKELTALSVFAPDHQPYNLEGVLALETAFPDLPQSLSFDTAFHRSQPWVAAQYAIPRALTEKGLLRYGFHGLNYAWIAKQLPSILFDHPNEKVIALHLGSGASLCALRAGKSVATSMGLTAISGIPMATRSGDIDPGLVLHLIQQEGYSAAKVEDLLCHKSGLLGVSGESADIRVLLESQTLNADKAIDLFIYRIIREIGSLQAALGGLDAIVFTGGIGENSAEIRRRICHRLHWMGLVLDQTANENNASIISSDRSPISASIIPADEEAIIAAEATTCLIVYGPQKAEP